ncbi:MAG: nucleotide pyrophosphohydrolase [Lachnospiraceae bacterium]|nr:nucleotide pyrophosphohydrolase [Lachnospiraceae bacterium]
MIDFTVNEMLTMQKELQENYKDKWEPIIPETGKNKLLWMIGEVGEVIDIVKKNGDKNATEDPALRKELIEEMADVLMYYNDVLLCYGITAEELKNAYTDKFERNLKQWRQGTL